MTQSSNVSGWRGFLGRGVTRVAALSAVAAMMVTGRPVQAATPKEVDDAVDKGVAYLLSQQKPDGSWDGPKPKGGAVRENHAFGGLTAISTYALLVSGMKANDPQIKKAIQWLETNDLHGTYAVGLRAQVWNSVPYQLRIKDKTMLLVRDHDKDFVLFSKIQRGPNMGFYSYTYGGDMVGSLNAAPGGLAGFSPLDPKGPAERSGYDRSNSQYGVYGAWALEQAGAEIPTQYWLDEDAAWKKAQMGDGGWCYNGAGGGPGEGASTYTMTSAGLATLFITQDYVLRTNFHQFDSCKGGVTNPNIEKGLAWMDKHIGQALGGNGGGWYLYGMYGIERVGVASGRKYFGNIDWYKTGADSLVKKQAPTGSWGAIHDTCFATLFLCRGRAPVMMNKVMYETASKKQVDPWNERPRDCANLSKWMGTAALEGFLNWQIVNLNVPVEDLHDAPILYISGSEELSLSNQDIDKLRLFVEQGGMILGNADCASKNFTKSFHALGAKLFPKYEFRRLPQSHPIFSEQYLATKWKTHPIVEGLSNGVRELMIIAPETDMGKAWQTEANRTQEHAFQLAGNIFLYATGKENLSHKGDTYIVQAEGEGGREIKVARIQAGENFDPEPGAWRRLSAILHNTRHMDIKTETIKLGEGKLSDFKIASLTGTTKLLLGENQRKEITDFVAKGGTLIVDATGGSTDFADSAENQLKQIFGEAGTAGLATPLPPTHALYTDPNGKIEKFKYRSYSRRLLTGSAREPRVRGITVGGRIAVFYSREDLTAGCVGQQVDGILGYDPAIATQIMLNAVMYADSGGKGAVAEAPAPSPAAPPAEPTAKP